MGDAGKRRPRGRRRRPSAPSSRGCRRATTPTRPQPMITTCTSQSLPHRPGLAALGRTTTLRLVVKWRTSSKRLLVGRAKHSARARGDAPAQASRASGVRKRRDVVGGLRHPGDPHHPGAGGDRVAEPYPLGGGGGRGRARRPWSPPTGRTCAPTPAVAATTRWPTPTWVHQFGLVVAAALLVDYVLTVAVSTSAGVENLASTPVFGWMAAHRVVIMVCGGDMAAEPARRPRVRRTFAIPTYVFVVGVWR